MDENDNIDKNRLSPIQREFLQGHYYLKPEHHNEKDVKFLLEKYAGLTHLMDNGYIWNIKEK